MARIEERIGKFIPLILGIGCILLWLAPGLTVSELHVQGFYRFTSVYQAPLFYSIFGGVFNTTVYARSESIRAQIFIAADPVLIVTTTLLISALAITIINQFVENEFLFLVSAIFFTIYSVSVMFVALTCKISNAISDGITLDPSYGCWFTLIVGLAAAAFSLKSFLETREFNNFVKGRIISQDNGANGV